MLRQTNFNSLIFLFDLKIYLEIEYFLPLTFLFSSNFKCQNVKCISSNFFNHFVKKVLLKFGTKLANSTDAADFIDVASTWWKILNVKTLLTRQTLRGHFQKPITTDNANDSKLVFFRKMISWLILQKPDDFPQKFTSQTHPFLLIRMLEIFQYCLLQLKMSYVLEKFQTNPLHIDLENTDNYKVASTIYQSGSYINQNKD